MNETTRRTKMITGMITNQSYDAAIAARLPVERAWICRPQTEWLYSHHPSVTFFRGRYYAIWPNGLCEGAFYQADDGGLHMLLRTNTERLWQTESVDDGASWSPPQPAAFSDNATKFHFGRLPDGRFYDVGCPDPEPRWQRSPLVLSLSGDGKRFDRHLILADDSTPYEQCAAGMHKGGDYGYPHTLVHDGCLHVVVSRRKEAVEVLRVHNVARAFSSGIEITEYPEQDAPATHRRNRP